jgi:hypothetical protein
MSAGRLFCSLAAVAKVAPAVMRAHGFTDDQLMKLERLGIVAKTTECVVSGLQAFEVVRLKIREAGH